MKFAYLLINLFTIIGPLAGSFQPTVNFKSKWKYAIPAVAIVAVPFLIWDAVFTKWGVWGFNSKYYLGIKAAGLPVEEWMFFITVPFACLLIYEAVCTLNKTNKWNRIFLNLATISGAAFMFLAIMFIYQQYTFAAFLFAGALLFIHGTLLKKKYFSNFAIAYIISLIPFFIVNGILTALPVVWYNDQENFGIRIFSIPIEDSVYSLLLLLGNVTVYEAIKNKQNF
jgi:lycopene cyclase domain-containing protein